MKKIIKYFILIFISFIPVMVDAKATFEFKDEVYDLHFLYKEKDKYYFLDNYYNYNEDGFIKIFDDELELIKGDKMFDGDNSSEELMIKSKYFNKFYNYYSQDNSIAIDYDTNRIYDVRFPEHDFLYYDIENDEYLDIDFDEDINFTRRILGKRYDVFLWAKNNNFYIYSINEINDYFIVYYEDEGDYFVAVLDSNLELIRRFSNENHIFIHVHDDLIYVLEDNIYLKIYNLAGDIVGRMTIENDNVSSGMSCYYLAPFNMSVTGSELFINYELFMCPPSRINGNDESFYNNAKGRALEFLTLVYDINFEIDKVKSNNGDFTYVEKIDESGKAYVELKITPQEGYEVDKIIVIDVNGNIIEVNDNKFYMPNSDVKIEIQYKEVAEYVPIPDTFLGRNLTIIFIGLILIGLGVYTVNYVKN